jgi:hypothetical protein
MLDHNGQHINVLKHFVHVKSTSSIYKVFDNFHMLWMGIWIHHHAITTAQTILSVGEWNQTILSVGEWLETIVQWLRLKTHLEWFQHPPQLRHHLSSCKLDPGRLGTVIVSG